VTGFQFDANDCQQLLTFCNLSAYTAEINATSGKHCSWFKVMSKLSGWNRKGKEDAAKEENQKTNPCWWHLSAFPSLLLANMEKVFARYYAKDLDKDIDTI